MSEGSNARTRQEWALAIGAAWQKGVESIIETGRLLTLAKAELLEHGEFLGMVEKDLPFGITTADRLQAIAHNPVLSNSAHGLNLPPSWRTLYELSRVGRDPSACEKLEKWIADGVVHPEMERSEVAELLRSEKREDYESQIEDGCTVEDLNELINAGKKFAVIYADPPWLFKVYSGKGKARSADRHYDTMSLDDIKALPVAQLAADDCALLLWSVWPEMAGAMAVIEAWGFTYKTAGFVWTKETPSRKGLHWGMGYWTRANTEPCLLATRGSPKRQAKDVHQVIMSPVGPHSRKPEETQARIERLLPGPYLELFGRRPMKRWTVWGNQISRGLFHGDIPEFAA